MDTLGSLCDKLSVLKLKQWHTSDQAKLSRLDAQEQDLKSEINAFFAAAVSGFIPLEKLTCDAHKVYGQYEPKTPEEDVASAFSKLAEVNCQLWHEIDKSYRVDRLNDAEKSALIRNLASLNLDRNQYKESIDNIFSHVVYHARHLSRL